MKKLLILLLLLFPLVAQSATITSVGSGNWSDTSKWDLSRIPAADDAVVIANGHTMIWDGSLTRIPSTSGTLTSITAVGGTGAITLALDDASFHDGAFLYSTTITAGTTSDLLTITGTTDHVLTVSTGNTPNGIIAGASGHCIKNSGSGTLNITGDVSGGAGASRYGVNNASTGTLSVTGNVYGGSAVNSGGIFNLSSGVVNITGNVTGGSNAGTYGLYLYLTSNGVVSILGATSVVTGGTGAGSVGIWNEGNTNVTLASTVNLVQGTKAAAFNGGAPKWTAASAAATGIAKFYVGTGFLQAANTEFPQGLAAGNIKSGVTSGSVTGTLSAGGSAAAY
jgi:hypothetical protein